MTMLKADGGAARHRSMESPRCGVPSSLTSSLQDYDNNDNSTTSQRCQGRGNQADDDDDDDDYDNSTDYPVIRLTNELDSGFTNTSDFWFF